MMTHQICRVPEFLCPSASYRTVSLEGREPFFFVSSVSLHISESLGCPQTLSQLVSTLFSFLIPSFHLAFSTGSLSSCPIPAPPSIRKACAMLDP